MNEQIRVNCKYCLPCGICERKSSFDETIMCNQFQAIELKPQRKTCMNCLNKGIAMKDYPCNECKYGSNWREQYHE